MNLMFKKLAKIGVSEFLLIFLLVLALGGAIALSSANVNFQVTILPPPPPSITTILGDPENKAVLVIGSTLSNARVRAYAFSEALMVETTADADGAFFVVFTADMVPPGRHEFTVATVLNERQTTDPAPRVAVAIQDDYTIEQVAGSGVPTVKIGNADGSTSQLIRNIIRSQEAAKRPSASELPDENKYATRARLLQLALFLVIALETGLLLLERSSRKTREGKNFLHFGRGFYRLPPRPVNTSHPHA